MSDIGCLNLVSSPLFDITVNMIVLVGTYKEVVRIDT